MKSFLTIVFISIFYFNSTILQAQDTIRYHMSFTNAVHHECLVSILIQGVPDEPLYFNMSNSSPGRYANHEFAKNVYSVEAISMDDELLPITKTGISEWMVIPENGYVKLYYNLYANHPDGTYAGIDQTFALLNMPASIMWVKGLENKPVKIDFDFHESTGWKVSTQLPHLKANSYYAPDLYYLMDSPTVLAKTDLREFVINDDGKEQKIKVVFNPDVDDVVEDQFTELVKKVVKEGIAVFGELPAFDFGEYTFLCSNGEYFHRDAMEHRNSTMITFSNKLEGNEYSIIDPIAHEFFHIWNIERIRPKSLEPFDFTQVNSSGELWFGEGFTEYYSDLLLRRSNIKNDTEFFGKYSGILNYVLNSPGIDKHSLVQMSHMAPFVDASIFIDKTNFQNTFSSYYYYGALVAFALDLSIRSQYPDKSLDDYMKLLWNLYGKTEIPYTLQNLKGALAQLTGDISFANSFFSKHIEGKEQPKYDILLNHFGYSLDYDSTLTDLVTHQFKSLDKKLIYHSHPIERSTFYLTGINKGDVLISVNEKQFSTVQELTAYFNNLKIGDVMRVKYLHFGKEYERTTLVKPYKKYQINAHKKPTDQQLKLQKSWLESKAGN